MGPPKKLRSSIPNVVYNNEGEDGLPFIITKVESIRPCEFEARFKTSKVKKEVSVSLPCHHKKIVTHKSFPKPPYSYACLIAMSIKNSKTGGLPVGGIYKFLCEHFPYFKSAPKGWKDQIRSYLKTKYFEKRKTPGFTKRTGNYWIVNPSMQKKFDDEILRWSQKNPVQVKSALFDPENLEKIERGELTMEYDEDELDL